MVAVCLTKVLLGCIVNNSLSKFTHNPYKDDELDFLCEDSQEGIFGINIHKSNPYTESQRVDKWSAGCQVFKRAQDYAVFMGLCDRASNLYGNSFTYTLLEEQDFNV